MLKKPTILFFLFFFANFLFGQGSFFQQTIVWNSADKFTTDNGSVYVPNCSQCNLLNRIPYFTSDLNNSFSGEIAVMVKNYEAVAVSSEERKYLMDFINEIPNKPKFAIFPSVYRGLTKYVLQGVPLIVENGVVKKITNFTYTVKETPFPLKAKSFVASSVLGDLNKKWFKIAVSADGVYKLDKAFLASMGINVNTLNPKHINIYGNANGTLPIANFKYRPDDLVKNPIFIAGESDNTFDEGDYILFHAYGPSKWSYNQTGLYRRELNPYTSSAYYFVCIDANDTPLRIGNSAVSSPETATVTMYDYSVIHESEQRNLMKGGQRFYGEEFDSQLTQSFSFSLPDYVASPSKLYVSYAAQNTFGNSNTFKISYNGQQLSTSSIPSSNTDEYARAEQQLDFTPNSSSATVTISVNRNNPKVLTYLDKIEFFIKRNLRFLGGNMYFHSADNISPTSINKYVVSGVPADAEIWDVTRRTNPVRIQGQLSGSNYEFKAQADTIREFVIFTPSSYLKPSFVEEVSPQNLHALSTAEILIVTHPKFLTHANRLADIHRNIGETVNVVTVNQIYNEFSSGQPDPVAIRYFAKMFYDRANGNANLIPKNLILFGNGHYDPRQIVLGENYVLSYQNTESETDISAFSSDDFYTVLDDAESFSPSDQMDMGVGRMIASTTDEASILLKKVETYLSHLNSSGSTVNDWQTNYGLIADAEDTFITGDCEKVYKRVKKFYPELNATKIYADAYPQQISAGGIRLPEMEADITNRVESGAVLMAYVGHGGPRGGGQSRFINHDQINSWKNGDKLHLFVSATCDFARIDDPNEVTAGGLNMLNPNGGAIAMMTTTRPIYYTTNTSIDTNFFKNVFERDANYKSLTFGEIFMHTKNNSLASDNKRSFTLIGDPALRIALPHLKVVTDSLNGVEMTNLSKDTLKALSKITVKGHLTDANGNLLSGFNGVISPSVFDKEKLNKTLGAYPGKTTVLDFYTQNNIIYRGNISVTNGKFQFSFIVPKDINYQFGKGKITYYAANDVIDAGGADTTIVVGGINPNGIQDNTPPIIEGFMNDEKFVNGGMTDENPIFKANLKDDYGINAVGNGVGHDITLVIDGDETKPIILNNYYTADLDSYQSGKISYPMKGLELGPHKLKLKAWDVNNNPAEFLLDFLVVKKEKLALSHVLNYPNPFTTSTEFYFEHNQFSDLLEAQIQIFTVSGKLVKTINSYVQTSGFRSNGIHWDGRDDFGDQLAKGVYIYTLTVKNSSGNKVQKTEKLVILK